MGILENINSASDLKRIPQDKLPALTEEIREFIIDNVSKTGGHLASNLGTVELTIALLRIFDAEYDRIIWDVGHQSYTYKILTGRKDRFSSLRQAEGISGFPKTSESKADAFNTGHSSTSISLALGFAAVNKIKDVPKKSIAVIGDGALTGGLAFEAINNAAALKLPIIIILNDNGMSISENVGGISAHLKKIKNDNLYFKLKALINNNFENSSEFGRKTVSALRKTRDFVKKHTIGKELFENLGLKYYGPIDGHNISSLESVLNYVKNFDKPVLIHIKTTKGKGYLPAEENPGKFHGIGKFDKLTGDALSKKDFKTYSEIFGETIFDIAKTNQKVVAITAAMPESTGLSEFSKAYPDRFFDCGIAEEHAVTFSAAISEAGFTPVFAVYSTFLQRAYDEILHDVAINNKHVVFAIDRAGVVGEDGETHQGIYDLSYLSHIPNMTIMAPSGEKVFAEMLDMAINTFSGPVAIRYPRGAATDPDIDVPPLSFLKAETYLYGEKDKAECVIISIGTVLKDAVAAAKILEKKGHSTIVVDARFLKPLDEETIKPLIDKAKAVACVEDNIILGGLSDSIRRISDKKVLAFGYEDEPVLQGSITQIKEKYGITSENIAEKIIEELKCQK